MTSLTRRKFVKGGTAVGAAAALAGPALLQWARAWAQTAPWKPERGAQLSLLRWKDFLQAEDDAFVATMDAFTEGHRRQSEHHPRIERRRATEGIGCGQYRRPARTLFWGLLLATAFISNKCFDITRCRGLSRQVNTAAGCRARSPMAKAAEINGSTFRMFFTGSAHQLPYIVAKKGWIFSNFPPRPRNSWDYAKAMKS